MKKAVIILSVLAVIASGCGQTRNNATRKYAGIYTFGDTSKDSEERNGTLYLYPETDSTMLFYIFVINGAPSYNSGSIDGRIKIHDLKAVFRKRFSYEQTDCCVLRFEFNENTLTVIEDEIGCGFGHNVYIGDTFRRTSSKIPEYYTAITNDKVYFSEWQEDSTEVQAVDNNETVKAEETSDSTSFVEETDWPGVKCTEHSEDGGYTTIKKCTFPNAKLQQVYNIIKKLDSNLKSELPTKDVEYPSTDGGCISVKYHYTTEKHLLIKLTYEGGETDFEIIENGNETQSKITYSAD